MLDLGNESLKEYAVRRTKEAGVLPCIKLHEKADWIAYAQAMVDGGAKAVEVTMTTPGALEAIEAISSHFGKELLVAAGTVLDAATAREVILHGGSILVNPCVVEDVLDVANRYQVPIYSGAFTATEVFQAMRAGASMVKIFPGGLGGAKQIAGIGGIDAHPRQGLGDAGRLASPKRVERRIQLSLEDPCGIVRSLTMAHEKEFNV